MPELAVLGGGAATADPYNVPGTEIVSVLLTERINPAGRLIDVMQIGFNIDGYPGTFYVHPDASGDWLDAAVLYMEKEMAQVKEIYALGG